MDTTKTASSLKSRKAPWPIVVLLLWPVLQTPALAADANQQLSNVVKQADELMEEPLRTATRKVVVRPGAAPVSGAVTGSYQKETLGLLDGMDEGRNFGTMTPELSGIPVSFPIRILQVPGTIIGGLIGASTREIQDYRDTMTENLVTAAKTDLSNESLANDVFWLLHAAPHVDAKVLSADKPNPADTDAVLFISFSDFSIDVQKSDAVLTMAATASLRRISDGQRLYDNQVFYQDAAPLADWTANDSAAWKSFASYARHYLGREIVAEIMYRVPVVAELVPAKSKSIKQAKKNPWKGVSKTTTPTLAWNLALAADDKQTGWASDISTAMVSYDLEVYDKQAMVYAARSLEGNEFALDVELQPCKTYRWSVRPSYTRGGETRHGQWMRSNPDPANGNVGEEAAVAPAYLHDFAELEIKCGRR